MNNIQEQGGVSIEHAALFSCVFSRLSVQKEVENTFLMVFMRINAMQMPEASITQKRTVRNSNLRNKR